MAKILCILSAIVFVVKTDDVSEFNATVPAVNMTLNSTVNRTIAFKTPVFSLFSTTTTANKPVLGKKNMRKKNADDKRIDQDEDGKHETKNGTADAKKEPGKCIT
jgi:hypothetical protein